MSRLDEDRMKIDEIDAQLAALFQERFKVVRDVIEYKIENRLPILDSSREEEIVNRNCDRITDEDLTKYFRKYYTQLISLSREFQQDILDQQ